MDQIKIGNFIQTIRKEKGLTQKELAEKLGVSDKAVSKWETGNGMPDISLLQKLCATLNININEFLSGEKIDRDDYNIKAEENIFQLLTQSKASGRSRKITVTAGIILFASIFAFTFTSLKDKSLLWFLDLPSLIITAGFCLSVMLIGARGQNPARLILLRKTIIPWGTTVSLLSAIAILGNLGNPELTGQNLAVGCLSLLYSLVSYIIISFIDTGK